MGIKSCSHVDAIEIFAAFQEGRKTFPLAIEERFEGVDVHLGDAVSVEKKVSNEVMWKT